MQSSATRDSVHHVADLLYKVSDVCFISELLDPLEAAGLLTSHADCLELCGGRGLDV